MVLASDPNPQKHVSAIARRCYPALGKAADVLNIDEEFGSTPEEAFAMLIAHTVSNPFEEWMMGRYDGKARQIAFKSPESLHGASNRTKLADRSRAEKVGSHSMGKPGAPASATQSRSFLMAGHALSMDPCRSQDQERLGCVRGVFLAGLFQAGLTVAMAVYWKLGMSGGQ